MEEMKNTALKILMRTARSLTIQILDEGADYHTKEYDIYINGEKYLTTDKTVETVYGLRPAEDLTVSVGRSGERSEELSVRTAEEFVTLNVRDFGARGDGETDDTLSIQAAIMTCPENSRVLIPEGTFRFTNLFLKSDLTLELAKGAVLLRVLREGDPHILHLYLFDHGFRQSPEIDPGHMAVLADHVPDHDLTDSGRALVHRELFLSGYILGPSVRPAEIKAVDHKGRKHALHADPFKRDPLKV